jgi:hypothetical protein
VKEYEEDEEGDEKNYESYERRNDEGGKIQKLLRIRQNIKE